LVDFPQVVGKEAEIAVGHGGCGVTEDALESEGVSA